jgi:hypothetical protein
MIGPKQRIKQLFFSAATHRFPAYHVNDKSLNCGISMLLCHRYVLLCIYTLTSLFHEMGITLPVFIVDDGSLTSDDKRLLAKHFSVTFMEEKQSQLKLKKILQPYPHLSQLRFSSQTGLSKKKIFDAALLHPFERFIILDSDFLFFKKPKEIVSWILNKENSLLYGAHQWKETDAEEDPEIIVRRILYTLFPSKMDVYNSTGLLCIPSKKFIDLAYLQKIIVFFEKVKLTNRWLLDQHVFSLLLGKQKMKLLPPHSYINVWKTNQYDSMDTKNAVSIHYAGENKVIFSRDAIRLALQKKFFRYPIV